MVILIVDLLIIAALLASDLVSKHFAAKYLLAHGGYYEAIKNVLAFRYSENTGAAFGIFSDARVFLCVLVGIVVAGILVFMAYNVIKKKHREKGGVLLHVALSFVVAGGIGNLIDRATFGYVRDFIEYTIVYTLFKKNFAICNLADVFLTFGVIMLAIYLIAFYMRDGKNDKISEVFEQNEEVDSPADAATPLEASEDNLSARAEAPASPEDETGEKSDGTLL